MCNRNKCLNVILSVCWIIKYYTRRSKNQNPRAHLYNFACITDHVTHSPQLTIHSILQIIHLKCRANIYLIQSVVCICEMCYSLSLLANSCSQYEYHHICHWDVQCIMNAFPTTFQRKHCKLTKKKVSI